MKVWLFTGGITAVSNGAYLVTCANGIAIPRSNTIQMCIVMHSPLRSQNNDDVSAEFEITTIDDESRRSRDNYRAAFLEYIDAFVHARFSPRLEPERILVPIVGIGTENRINQPLRHEESETNDEYRDQEDNF
jgi:hypothetical protein